MAGRKKHDNNKGFTLVELIVVLIIIALLVAILTPALLGYIDNARKEKEATNAKAVLNADREMLVEKADLEEDTVDDVLRILRAEFE